METIETPSKKKRKNKGGVKLFQDSQHYLTTKNEEAPILNGACNRIDEGDELVEMKKIKSISVDPEDILSKKDTLSWSNRSKAPVFRYRRKNKELYLIE